MKKLFPFSFVFFILFLFLSKPVFAIPVLPGAPILNTGNSYGNCAYVKVGDPKITPDLSRCLSTSGQASTYAQKVIEIAKTQIGKPYSQPKRCGPDAWHNKPPPVGCAYFDCSSFAGWSWFWGTEGKFKMYGQTCRDFGDCLAQYDNYNYYPFDSNKYEKFLPSQINLIQPGDLVYFGENSRGDLIINHVGIYEGNLGSCGSNDCIIHSTNPYVTEAKLSSRMGRFQGFLRPKIN